MRMQSLTSMLAALGCAAACTLGAVTALAQAPAYPSKPIRLVVPFPPGGSPDLLARTLSSKLQDRLGQPVVVENLPGAGGAIGAQAVARAPADGYTWLVTPNSVLVFAPLLGPVPYDPVKDFAPVGQAIAVENLLVVHPSVQAKTVQELVALARANPGKLTYGSGGPGSPQQFSMELFKSMSGTDITHVPYKGAQAALPDLLAGRVDVFLGQANSLIPHIEAGRLRVLAGTGSTRYASMPNVPTVAETLPGYAVDIWSGLAMPAGTPKDIVDRISAEMARAIDTPEVRAEFAKQGVAVRPGSPQQMGDAVSKELASWGRVVKEANIKGQ